MPARPPNILILLADDMGFSDAGCYGGEIATPNLDGLGAHGLRFTQFYNTARCWPTRGALLTGYYPQQIRADPPKGQFPSWVRTLPQLLKPLGYRCYHAGKWHITGATHALADAGFDHSYRVEDHNRNFGPRNVIEDDVPLPGVSTTSGYYTTIAYADSMVRYLREHARQHPSSPFFAFVAFTVPHFPLQALPQDIELYQNRYRAGWDVLRQERHERLTPLRIPVRRLPALEPWLRAPSGEPNVEKQIGPGEVAYALAWDDLEPEQRRFQAMKMAIHAAMIDRMDREIGRILEQLRQMGAWDDTLVFFLSDNGASAEILVRGDGHNPNAPPGSPASFLCLGPGWSTAANTPFRRHKIWVHEGGVSTPLIVHWPRGITARGALRHDLGHVVDLVPTLLEVAGATPPTQAAHAPPFPGRSLVPAFHRDGALGWRELFFQHAGNRALRQGDWKTVSAAIHDDRWELYDLGRDRGETKDLAARHPARLRQMTERWTQLEGEFRQQASTTQP